MAEEGDVVKIDFTNEEVKKQVSEHVNKNYRSYIPKEFAEDSTMAHIPDLHNLARSYVSAQGLVGRKGLIVPTEKDAPEIWEKFYNTLGRPEKATEYEYEPVEGMTLDLSEVRQEFSEAAHKAGMTRKQAKEAWKFFEGKTKDGQDAITSMNKERYDKEWGTLKQEWGATYPEKIKKIEGLLSKFGDEETREFIKKSGAGKETKLVKFLSKIADSMSEDKINVGSRETIFTPEEAMSKANDIRTNKSNPLYEAFWKKEHPRHDEASKEIDRLYKMSFKEKK